MNQTEKEHSLVWVKRMRRQ